MGFVVASFHNFISVCLDTVHVSAKGLPPACEGELATECFP